jgi:hypothetical protein
MKKLYLLVFCLLLIVNCFSQGFNWQWAHNARTVRNSEQEGYSTACSGNNGVYLAGFTNATTIFGADTLVDTAGTVYVLARYDAAGNFKWVATSQNRPIGINSFGLSVTSDVPGNAVLCGWFKGDTMFVGNTWLHATSAFGAAFIVKYDTLGNLLWATQADGAWADAVATDAYNNIYVSGYYADSVLTIGDSIFRNAGNVNAFLAKLDSAGNLLWAQTAGGSNQDYGYAVATDSAGNVYFTGSYNSDTFNIADTVFYNVGNYAHIFTAKFNQAGRLIWITVSQGYGSLAQTVGICTDGNNSVYITGCFNANNIMFGQDTVYPSYTGQSRSFFLAKYDSAGNALWAKGAIGNGDNIQGYSVLTDTGNNLYLTGGFGYLLGIITDSVIIDSTLLTAPGEGDPSFVMKLGPGGNVLMAQSFVGGGDDQNWLCLDHQGNGYWGGDYLNPGYGVDSMAIGGDTLWMNSIEAFYIAKFSTGFQCHLQPPQINANTDTICASDSVRICAPPGYASYRWSNSDTSNCFYTNEAGNYYVTVTDRNNCSAASNSIALTVNTPPPVSITVNGDTLTANNGITFQWYLNGSLITGATHSQIIAGNAGQYTVQITDSNGCSAVSNAVTLGMEEVVPDGADIFPNPCNNIFRITMHYNWKSCPVTIYNSARQVVLETELKGLEGDIDVQTLASGVYYVRIETYEGAIIKKLVKM